MGYTHYSSTEWYELYLHGGSRPDDSLLPELQFDAQGNIMLVPGEVYCRFKHPDGATPMCRDQHRFAHNKSLRGHYRAIHRRFAFEHRTKSVTIGKEITR